MKHTPGPWIAGSTSVTAPETEDRLGMSLRIYGGNDDDNRANARLIAAAPDLLYLLKEAELFVRMLAADGTHAASLAADIRAGIAKATGRDA